MAFLEEFLLCMRNESWAADKREDRVLSLVIAVVFLFLRWIKLRVFRRLKGSSSRKGKTGVNEKAKEELLV